MIGDDMAEVAAPTLPCPPVILYTADDPPAFEVTSTIIFDHLPFVDVNPFTFCKVAPEAGTSCTCPVFCCQIEVIYPKGRLFGSVTIMVAAFVKLIVACISTVADNVLAVEESVISKFLYKYISSRSVMTTFDGWITLPVVKSNLGIVSSTLAPPVSVTALAKTKAVVAILVELSPTACVVAVGLVRATVGLMVTIPVLSIVAPPDIATSVATFATLPTRMWALVSAGTVVAGSLVNPWLMILVHKGEMIKSPE
jgi:hypothetical protein